MTYLIMTADWFYALTMGIVQGLTEFLPISSSGHLSLLNLFFERDATVGIDFTFFLHIATLLAAIIYFRRDLRDLVLAWLPKNRKEGAAQRRITVFLFISCLVTAPLGLLLEDRLAAVAGNLLLLGLAFLLTATVLTATELLTFRKDLNRPADQLTIPRAAGIGFAQGCAVLPGFSRSGATIAAGMWTGLSRTEATRYSFLLAIPIILAGAAKDCFSLIKGTLILPPFAVSLLGFVAAGIAGYVAIAFMLKLVQRTTLIYFALYTALLGLALIALSFV